jgi:ADP-ribose pyrophosphatase
MACSSLGEVRMADVKKVFTGDHLYVLERDGWQFVERKSATEAVAVLAVTADGEVILTEQYRRPVDARVIDYPAGLVGDEGSDDPAETAKKELEEETGFSCESVERLARGPSSPGIVSELVSFYRANNVHQVGDGGGVDGEDITVHRIPQRDLLPWLERKEREGCLIDLKIWGGLYFLIQK